MIRFEFADDYDKSYAVYLYVSCPFFFLLALFRRMLIFMISTLTYTDKVHFF